MTCQGAMLEDQPPCFVAPDCGDSAAKPEDAIELIQAGLNPDGEPGKEPLRIAARSGNAQLCRILIKMGAKPLSHAPWMP